jgi:hypothetical protein
MRDIVDKINLFEQKTIEKFSKQSYIETKYYLDFDNTNFPIL